jgi:putative flippase GtrA
MKSSRILTTYGVFCLIATGFNLGLQFIVSNWFSLNYWTALIIGTLGGLILKYVLDRNYIFNATNIKIQTDIKRFTIYSFLEYLRQ